jgi:5-methyltetrahydrofolate--homocysteine methyltransferase
MKKTFLEMIAGHEPVIYDGALGTEIQKAEPTEDDFGGYDGCCEYLNISRPDIIETIHIKYLEAGAHVIETNTFGGNRTKLDEFGLWNRVYEINKAAAEIARQAIEKTGGGGRPRFVCGTMGPTGFLPSSSDKELSYIKFDQLVDIFKEQAEGLIDGGADILLIETSQDLLEVRAAMLAVRKLCRSLNRHIPLQVQATMDGSGKMLLGSDVSAFLGAVQAMGADVVGLNCSSGPDEMAPWIDQLLVYSTLPVSMLPNAGLPHNEDGRAVYKMGPVEFANKMRAFAAQKGVAVVGGCCGTTPEHIRTLADSLAGLRVAERGDYKRGCFLSTGISGIDLECVTRPVIIGERLNTQGSKKTKEFVINRSFDELYHIAKEQIDRKSSLIDICVAANELDIGEAEMMVDVVKFLRDRVTVPFCIDTTEPAVMEAALKQSPGSVLINSINLEHGGEKAKQILQLAADFGCPVIALTIDDKGMAAAAQRKLEVARELIKLAHGEYNLPEHCLYIDPLVFTLATGDTSAANAALESLEALRLIKKDFPNVRTVMGVSNVSFGLKPKARRILNNLMLHYAVEAGLDAAIFNPMHVDDVDAYNAETRELGDDLLLNRREDALQRFVEYFENETAAQSSKNKAAGTGADVRAGQSPEMRLRGAVVGRDRRGLEELIGTLLKDKPASDILNKILLPAMSEVGEKMASGEMILPFVLQSAEVMKEAVSILAPHLKDGGGGAKGKLVIATVYGDVHDIGKNLVASILRNQGFDVVDLGKQVSVDTIVEAVYREKPDAVGLSALLVTTSRQMAECVRRFARLEIDVPIIIGGAAVNKDFAARISRLDNGTEYAPGVYYAKDAFDVVKIFDGAGKLSSAENGRQPNDRGESIPAQTAKRGELKYDYYIEPPHYGTGEALTWDIGALLANLNREKLFKAWWGGGNLEKGAYTSARKEEFEPVFERLSSEIVKDGLVDARGFYGFFPVIADNENIIILDPSDHTTERLSFRFPVMEKKGLSLADYVRPGGDVISAQAVTIGGKISERCREYLKGQDRYSDGFYLNALGSCLVETLAEKVSGEIRRALGLPREAGRRYSFGYPGLPGLEEQARLIEFLGVEERLGVTLTEGFQMQPEHSTVAIFVHHPDAEYL